MRFSRRNIFIYCVIFVIVIIILELRNNTSRLPKSSFHITNNDSKVNIDKFENFSSLIDGQVDEDRYERWISYSMSKVVPGLGDLGKPAYLLPYQKLAEKRIFSKKAMNVLLSDRISLERKLPDVRHSQCQSINYDINNLPSASVVIIFHNEALSILLRTIHSVVRETPPKLLKEIILVDDNSEEEELKGLLRYYVNTRFALKIEIVRLPYRQGLIKARLEGAKAATGDVLVFLDAHCEATVGWLEPLLYRIKKKRNAVVTPIVDVLSEKTLGYDSKIHQEVIGGFTWKAVFMWVNIPTRTFIAEAFPTSPRPTPAIVGGLLAVDRKYFWEFGSYDEEMTGWGGENLEMSFRTWMCGGRLEIIPCSRVGHIFKTFFPYTLPSAESILINLSRTVNVWMDDYTRLFYFHYNKVDFGNIQDRLELRKRLKCKSFKWYLQNIYPEKFVPDEKVAAYGRVRLTSHNLCLEGRDGEKNLYTLKVAECRDIPIYKQFFSLTYSGQLRTELRCAEVDDDSWKVEMNKCESFVEYKKWKLFQNRSLLHLPSRLCLDATGLEPGQEITASYCNGSPGQLWKFDHYKNDESDKR